MLTLELRDDGVAVISLDRPAQLNIVNLALRDALIEAVLAVRDLPDVGSLVLRANGRHFSAGADLSEFGSADSVFEARRIRWDRDPWGPLWDLPVPVVVALHGFALAAGMEMAMLCDIRVAAPDTVLGLPETKLGMLPAAGGTQSLTKAVGPALCLPIVATAQNLTALEALHRGIVHRVVDDVESEAMTIAKAWAALDPPLVRAAKRALRAAADQPLWDGLRTERLLARPR